MNKATGCSPFWNLYNRLVALNRNQIEIMKGIEWPETMLENDINPLVRLLAFGVPKSERAARKMLGEHGENCHCQFCVSARYTERNSARIPSQRYPGGFEVGSVRDTRAFRLTDEVNDEQ